MTTQETYTEALRAMAAVPNSVNLRRVFLLLTQAHFADPVNYGPLQDVIGDLHWDAEVEKRTLHISLQHDFDERGIVTAMPAVYFGLGSSNFTQTVVQNFAGHTDDNSGMHSVEDTQAAMQWFACARTADLAGNLMETCLSFFAAMRPTLIERLGLSHFQLATLSMPNRIVAPDSKEVYYRIDLQGVIHYNHALTLYTESHRLKTVELEQSHDAGLLDLRS